ncbi:YdiU family protein [Allorhizobium sp. BGMRC 0089]|uniref:protein adenylyltransferase SelO n=1 Tax=Allorhizobium sonneratiae TaxID=2934936 RepID=UPI002033CF63|nr:YdiU family protein [Allorhizobium sonneratiae]MCM2291174.1 YdiU family protein [Allorhizobium sonneratiae]
MFPFDNSYARLPERFFASVKPGAVRAPHLIRFNAALAEELGLRLDGEDEAALAALFSGNSLPEGAQPLAMAYAGHQFGQFVPQLGDGRAILLGEVVDRHGRRRDIQLKGAGETPFSRRGDGRAALGPVLREYIVSEAMHGLGIPTTRALAAVVSGEPVIRETVLPGAIFTRVAASHIRVGTFQFFAARGDEEGLRQLTDYVIARHYPALQGAENKALALLDAVAERQAALIARWMAVGFIHGVMNTDNMTISGETIDFGPCAFLDEYHPRKVFSSIDRQGRYAYANQPGIGQWNIARLAECLLPMMEGGEDKAVEDANAVLVRFGDMFQRHWLKNFRTKLGLIGEDAGDLALINDFLALLARHEADFTLGFRGLSAALTDGAASAPALFAQEDAAVWYSRWQTRLGNERPLSVIAIAMENANPFVIARNHRIEEAITAALSEDYTIFHRLVDAVNAPYSCNQQWSDLAVPPEPEQRVARTFCGT